MKKSLVLMMAVCMIGFTGCGNNNEIEKEPDIVLSQNTDNVFEKKDEPENVLSNSENNEIVENTVSPSPENTSNTEEKVLPSSTTSSKVEEPVKSPESIKEEMEKNVVIPQVKDDGVTVLKFKNTNSNEYVNSLNGKKVSITGYLSTLSPLNGQFAYLMNMPYQNCPFCVPGTSEITNTLAIFAGNKDKIKFTDQPVTVVGTLEVGDFTDDFGYQYGVRLNNVTVSKADVDKLSDTVKKYNLLAENGVVGDIYNSIMTADMSVFYNYYRMEKPDKVIMDGINDTKASVDSYNSKGDYNNLINVMNDLIALCNNVNNDVDSGDYSKFADYQTQLQDIYYTFAMWMAEGEL